MEGKVNGRSLGHALFEEAMSSRQSRGGDLGGSSVLVVFEAVRTGEMQGDRVE